MTVFLAIAQVLATIAAGALGSIVASFLFPSIQDFYLSIISKVLGWIPFRRRINLQGNWVATWHVVSDAYPDKVVDEDMEVRQFANNIFGEFKDVGASYYMVGKITSERIITGTWYDGRGGGYHGAFQLVLDPATHDLEGQWIGFSKSGPVKHGLFTLKRKDNPFTRYKVTKDQLEGLQGDALYIFKHLVTR